MNHSSTITKASKVYACNRTLSLTPHFISFPALRDFSLSLRQFLKRLGGDLEVPYWSEFIRPLKRYRFDLCAAPWPATLLREYTRERQIEARKHLLPCYQMYPSLAEPAHVLISTMEAIAGCDHDPVLEGFQSIADGFSDSDRVAIIITESRLVSIARQAIATVPDYAQWPVLVPQNVRGLDTYDCMIVIGSPGWYSQDKYVFGAPRAPNIHILCYDWMAINWRHEPSLTAPLKGSLKARQIPINYTPDIPGTSDDDIIPPKVDIDSVLRQAQKEPAYEGDHPVLARLLVLEDDKGVFIEVEGDATNLVIDLNQDKEQRVRRIIHRNIVSGLYILLRTAGGGDYIVPVADQILGDRAEELREMQGTWKARLRLNAKQNSLEETVSALLNDGSKVASYQNLRNWMQDRTIATHDEDDFLAIMKLVGLQDSAQRYWNAMKDIRRAHARAGRQIRRQLMQQVNKSDLAELERVGYMEFALEGKNAGSLTAYRIKTVARQDIEVHPRRINTPFTLEDM